MTRKGCTAKWKVEYATQHEAEQQLASMRANRRMITHRSNVYPCGDHWHIGTSNKRPGTRRRR